jgi:hypothetical protein
MDSTYYPSSPQSTARNNTLALVSMITGLGGWLLYPISLCPGFFGLIMCAAPTWVVGLLAWIAGVVTGHIAIKQIKDGGNIESGSAMAIAGLSASYAGAGLTCLLAIAVIVLIVTGVGLSFLTTLFQQ